MCGLKTNDDVVVVDEIYDGVATLLFVAPPLLRRSSKVLGVEKVPSAHLLFVSAEVDENLTVSKAEIP